MKNLNNIAKTLKSLSSGIQDIVNNVSVLCDLTPPESGEYSYTISGLGWRVVPPDLSETNERTGKGDGNGVGNGGFDLLGNYNPDDKRITIDVEKCRQYAKAIGVSEEAVTQIVMIHEVSHLVHHCGRLHHLGNHEKNSNDGIWKEFKSIATEELEGLAQATTYEAIKQNDRKLLSVFETMAQKAPTIYQEQNWKVYTNIKQRMDDVRSVKRSDIFDNNDL
jgi:hypothetical protein